MSTASPPRITRIPLSGSASARHASSGTPENGELLGDARTGVLRAGLRSWMRVGLNQQHVPAGARQGGRGRRAGRPGTHHQHLAPQVAHRYTVVTRGHHAGVRATRRRARLGRQGVQLAQRVGAASGEDAVVAGVSAPREGQHRGRRHQKGEPPTAEVVDHYRVASHPPHLAQGDDRVPRIKVMEQEGCVHHVDRAIGQRQGTHVGTAETSHHSYSPGYGGRWSAPRAQVGDQHRRPALAQQPAREVARSGTDVQHRRIGPAVEQRRSPPARCRRRRPAGG